MTKDMFLSWIGLASCAIFIAGTSMLAYAAPKLPTFEHAVQDEAALRNRITSLVRQDIIKHDTGKILFLSVTVSHAALQAKLKAAETATQRAAELNLLDHKVAVARDALELIPHIAHAKVAEADELVARLADLVSRAMNAATMGACNAVRTALDRERVALAQRLKKAQPSAYRKLIKTTFASVEQRILAAWDTLLYGVYTGTDEATAALEAFSLAKEWEALLDLHDETVTAKVTALQEKTADLVEILADWNHLRTTIADTTQRALTPIKSLAASAVAWPHGLTERITPLYDYFQGLASTAGSLMKAEYTKSRKSLKRAEEKISALVAHDAERVRIRLNALKQPNLRLSTPYGLADCGGHSGGQTWTGQVSPRTKV